MNVGEVDHNTATEWARKEIAGAAIYREWVGESEEEIHLRGKLFPKFYSNYWKKYPNVSGGLSSLDVMDNMRRLGQAHTLIRGDGWYLGWYVIERLVRGHTYLDGAGIGQQINFEALFQRVPVPEDPAGYYTALWTGTRT